MRLKDNNNPFIHVNPPYQLMVIHSSKLVYPRELYQRGVERKRVELIADHFNEVEIERPRGGKWHKIAVKRVLEYNDAE